MIVFKSNNFKSYPDDIGIHKISHLQPQGWMLQRRESWAGDCVVCCAGETEAARWKSRLNLFPPGEKWESQKWRKEQALIESEGERLLSFHCPSLSLLLHSLKKTALIWCIDYHFMLEHPACSFIPHCPQGGDSKVQLCRDWISWGL